MNNFDRLYKKYLNRTATEEERETFFALVRTGQYDDQIQHKILETIKKEMEVAGSPEERAVTNKILDRIDTGRPQQPSKSVPILPIRKNRTQWKAVAVAAMVLITALAGALYFNPQWLPVDTQTRQTAAVPGSYTGKQFVNLPDGSTVFLNEDSGLRYSKAFGSATREVTLTGEAYFDVQHDPARPFIVRTGDIRTQVLGTAFNVEAAEGEEVVVTVSRGKVEVGDDKKVYDQILPDEQLVVNPVTKDFRKRTIESENVSEWKEQFFVLNDVPIKEAAQKIEERYGVTITFTNPAIQECRITATFADNENIKQVMEVLSGIIQAEYAIDDGTVTIDGGRCR